MKNASIEFLIELIFACKTRLRIDSISGSNNDQQYEIVCSLIVSSYRNFIESARKNFIKMNFILFIFIVLSVTLRASGSHEQFDESAWMDTKARDKYFEYSDLTEPSYIENNNYSNNVELIQFGEIESRVCMRLQSWFN